MHSGACTINLFWLTRRLHFLRCKCYDLFLCSHLHTHFLSPSLNTIERNFIYVHCLKQCKEQDSILFTIQVKTKVKWVILFVSTNWSSQLEVSTATLQNTWPSERCWFDSICLAPDSQLKLKQRYSIFKFYSECNPFGDAF